MLSHGLEQGVLVITVSSASAVGERARILDRIGGLVHAHKPAPVVIVLDDSAVGMEAVRLVLRAHRLCGHAGVLMSVATHSAPARRLLAASAETTGICLVIHARADTAITTTAYAAAA